MCLVYLDKAKNSEHIVIPGVEKKKKKLQTNVFIEPSPKTQIDQVRWRKKNMGSSYLYGTDQMCFTKVFIILFTDFRTVTIKC